MKKLIKKTLKKKKETKSNIEKKAVFTNLDNNKKNDNQVYVNEKIIEAVLDAKKKLSDNDTTKSQEANPNSKVSDFRTHNPYQDGENESTPIEQKLEDKVQNQDTAIDEGEPLHTEPHPDDSDIYNSLFAETTIVSTQIYTYDIDKQLGEYNYISTSNYRVGRDNNDIGTIFTVTKNDLKNPIKVNHPHKSEDLKWYNQLAGLGYSYAAVCGTTVQGVVICEPLNWNNTLFIHHLMVSNDFRLNGIGAKMLATIYQRAKEGNFRAICVEVSSKNGSAIDFYRHMYFNITGLNIGLYSNTDMLKGDVGVFMQQIIV